MVGRGGKLNCHDRETDLSLSQRPSFPHTEVELKLGELRTFTEVALQLVCGLVIRSLAD